MPQSPVPKFLNRKSASAAIALAAAGFMTACYPIESDTPAIVEATRLHDLPLTSGRYCWVELEDSESIAVETLDGSACYEIDVYDGLAALTIMDDDYPETTFKAANLSRGALLLQHYDREEEAFGLYIAFMRENGFVLVPPPPASADVVENAGEHAVALKLSAGDIDDLLEDDYEDRPELAFAGGAPSDILAVVRDELGLMFDRALRDEEAAAFVFENALYLVRTDATPEEIEDGLPEEALRAAEPIVAELREAIGRAMALE